MCSELKRKAAPISFISLAVGGCGSSRWDVEISVLRVYFWISFLVVIVVDLPIWYDVCLK